MTTEFRVPDASCGHCKSTIEGALTGLEGVDRAELDLDSKLLRVEHADRVSREDLERVVVDVGYTAEVA